MPFQSEKQRRYLHANHPEIAKRWERDYATGGISNHFRKKLGDGTSLSDYLESPKYLDAYSQAHQIGATYPVNMSRTSKYDKQGISSDVRHTLGSTAAKEAIIDWVSNKIGVDPSGKVADVIGNLGITAATAKEEIPDAWRSVTQAFKEKDYGAITSGNVFDQPWEDVKANLNVWGIPYGASLEEKITAALPEDSNINVKDKIKAWKDKKQFNKEMMINLEKRIADEKRIAEMKAKAKIEAKAKADAAAAAQVRANIQTYGSGDRPNTGMNEPGGGKGQSPTGGDVAGTPFNRGGVARKNYYHGGILDINESEEIISDDGNDIELTDYNAAFDEPTGVQSLFQAKDGGTPRRRYFTGAYGGGEDKDEGPPGGGATSMGSGRDYSPAPTRAPDFVTGGGGTKTTTTSTSEGPGNIHGGPTVKEALRIGALKKSAIDFEKEKGGPEYYGLRDLQNRQTELITRIQEKITGDWKRYMNPSTWDKVKNIYAFTSISGAIKEIAKGIKRSRDMRAFLQDLEDIGLAGGPPGTNDPLYDQLWLHLEKMDPKYKKETKDEPEGPIYDPLTGAVDEEYAQGDFDYSYGMSDLDQIRAGQAKRAMINPEWQEPFGANKGGLANLFRVKKQ